MPSAPHAYRGSDVGDGLVHERRHGPRARALARVDDEVRQHGLAVRAVRDLRVELDAKHGEAVRVAARQYENKACHKKAKLPGVLSARRQKTTSWAHQARP